MSTVAKFIIVILAIIAFVFLSTTPSPFMLRVLVGYIIYRVIISKEKPSNTSSKATSSGTIDSQEIAIPNTNVIPPGETEGTTFSNNQTHIEVDATIPKTIEVNFGKDLTQSQKIIFSIALFLVCFILFYVWAYDVGPYIEDKAYDDNFKKMPFAFEKTWYVWIVFIAVQAWFQNKFWSSRSKLEIAFTLPNPHWLMLILSKHKRKILISISLVALTLIVAISIEPIKNYFAQQESQQYEEAHKLEEQARISHEDAVTKELNGSRKYHTRLKTANASYGLSVTVKGDYNGVLVTITAIYVDVVDQKGLPAFIIQPSSSYKQQLKDHMRLREMFDTDFDLVFHSKNYGVIRQHVNSKSMIIDSVDIYADDLMVDTVSLSRKELLLTSKQIANNIRNISKPEVVKVCL